MHPVSLTDKAPINKHTFTPWASWPLEKLQSTSSTKQQLEGDNHWNRKSRPIYNSNSSCYETPFKIIKIKKKRTIHTLQTIGHSHYSLKITGWLCNSTNLSWDTEEKGWPRYPVKQADTTQCNPVLTNTAPAAIRSPFLPKNSQPWPRQMEAEERTLQQTQSKWTLNPPLDLEKWGLALHLMKLCTLWE